MKVHQVLRLSKGQNHVHRVLQNHPHRLPEVSHLAFDVRELNRNLIYEPLNKHRHYQVRMQRLYRLKAALTRPSA